MAQPPAEQAPRPLIELARWLIRSYPTEPGWDELRLTLRPLRDTVYFQAVEVRGSEQRAKVGRLMPGNPPYDATRELQDDQVQPGGGSWIEASIAVAATGWPEPSCRVTGSFNRDAEPAAWQHEDRPLDATDLVHHLTRYPRRTDRLPSWMRDRIVAADLEVPPAAESSDVAPVAAATIPVVVDLGASAPEEDLPRATDRPRPEALEIAVDRDGPVLADGTRPGRRRYRLGGSLRLVDVLETVGSPLPFVDDRGTWIVRHGPQREEGRILAVVEQGPGASAGREPRVTVHLLSSAEPIDLLDQEDRLELYYCSVPGDLEVVLDSARLGEVSLPPTPAGSPQNTAVAEAVEEFAKEPGQTAMFHVLRQALGDRLIVDATGSDLPKPGEQAKFRLATLSLAEGGRGLGVFTDNERLVAFRKKSGGKAPEKITGLAQPGAQVVAMFNDNPDIDWLVINPGGPSCPIGKPATAFALSSPSNVAVKNLLAREHSTQELVAALSEPDGRLFLAQRTADDGEKGPAMLRDKNDGQPIMIAFTSPAEVGAYNAELGVLRMPVASVLQLTLTNRAKALIINPSGPRGALSSAQVWHALGNPELPPASTPRPVAGVETGDVEPADAEASDAEVAEPGSTDAAPDVAVAPTDDDDGDATERR